MPSFLPYRRDLGAPGLIEAGRDGLHYGDVCVVVKEAVPLPALGK